MKHFERIGQQWSRLKGKFNDPDFLARLPTEVELRPYLQGIPYWTAAAIVGVVAVLYSGGFAWCIEQAIWVRAHYPHVLLVTTPLLFAFSTWVVERFAPEAGGNGTSQVIHVLSLDSTLERSKIERFLNLRVALVIVVSTYLLMLAGGGLGREGPMIHISACLFYFVGKRLARFWPEEGHRPWIVAGGAAGVAAAFNAPLAGVVFVLEELAQQHFHRFRTQVITAAIIGGIVSQWISGKYLFLGYPTIGAIGLGSVPWAFLVGILCGISALPFHKMLEPQFKAWFERWFDTRIKFALFAGLCVAALAVYVEPGVIGGGVSTVKELLFKENTVATWSLIGGRYVATILAHLSGTAGGFLAPSLALGAAIGSKLAELTAYANPNLLTLVGMSAFLSAIVRAPFTAWVVVMEMTDRHSAIFPLMVASLVGHGTVQFFLERRRKRA